MASATQAVPAAEQAFDSQEEELQRCPRQLPLKQFRSKLNQEVRNCQRSHAKWSGAALAEALVARRRRFKQLTIVEVNSYMKAYQVQARFYKVFVNSCMNSIAFERAWQQN